MQGCYPEFEVLVPYRLFFQIYVETWQILKRTSMLNLIKNICRNRLWTQIMENTTKINPNETEEKTKWINNNYICSTYGFFLFLLWGDAVSVLGCQNGAKWTSMEPNEHQNVVPSLQNEGKTIKLEPNVQKVRQKAIPQNKNTMFRTSRCKDATQSSKYSAWIAFFLELCWNIVDVETKLDTKPHQK